MIKSKELIGPSCFTNAADDEPIFVLKSTDELAPWAERYRDQKGGFLCMTEKQTAKYWEACSLADQMDAWRSANKPSGSDKP